MLRELGAGDLRGVRSKSGGWVASSASNPTCLDGAVVAHPLGKGEAPGSIPGLGSLALAGPGMTPGAEIGGVALAKANRARLPSKANRLNQHHWPPSLRMPARPSLSSRAGGGLPRKCPWR